MAEQPDWLVQTKLQPPLLHSDTIKRSRPLEALRTAVTSRPVTLISAPAGYGKTTLIASLPRLLPDLKVAWLTLDEEDNDPARFLGALIASLQRIHPAVGAGAQQLLAGDLRRVVAVLINEIMACEQGPFVLVLDDLHFVTEPRAHAALDYLIDRLPPQMRLVIATRHDPPLALARLIARRQLAEVRRPHLSFTPDEARQLLNDTLGLQLSSEDLSALTNRTEGWAAGLCLLASSLERITTDAGRNALLTGLAQTDRYVFDFLAAEVLSHQEPATREFLLQTSILPDLTPALAEAVSGRRDAGRLLEELYRKNLFLVVDESGAYRYHALFAEFLRQQLEREQPDNIAELHRRAAVAQPSRTRAVNHFLAAGLYKEAARGIEAVGERLLLMGLSDTLSNWGAQIPATVQAEHPQLSLLFGRAAIGLGDYPAAYTLTERAKDGFARAGDRLNQAIALSILGSIGMLLGDVARCRAVTEQFFTLEELPGRIRARGTGILVYQRLHERRFQEAVAALKQTLALIEADDDLAAAQANAYRLGPWITVTPEALERMEQHCRWAEARVPADNSVMKLVLANLKTTNQLMRGRPAEAVAAAESALAIKERIGGYTWLGLASCMALASVSAARGDHEAAAAHADLLLQLTETAPPDPMSLWFYVAGRTFWLAGRHEQARQLLVRMQEAPEPRGFPMWDALQLRLSGLLLLSDGRPAEAENAAREAVRLEEAFPLSLAAGSARVLLIRALLEQNRHEAAATELQTLLGICEEQRMPGLLLQEGALITPLLQPVAARREPGGAIARATPQLPEPLTERELEVLRLLAGGATNHDIAGALIIGDETVKTHVARILRKLDVPSRAQAAARGKQLGLI